MVQASRTVGRVTATVEDVGIFEPSNPFWIPLWDTADGQLVTLCGATDDVPWTATAQADRVKIGARKYERGWARLIAFEVGFFATAAGSAARTLGSDHWPHEESDLGPVLDRAGRAALKALEVLERSRRFAQKMHQQSDPDLRIEELTIPQQVIEVARVWNEAAAQGINARRGQVVHVLGMAEKTATRRIAAAREQGLLIEKDSE